MNAAELMDILKSEQFVRELDEISAYLASVMQEKPIQYLIAKCLWQRSREYVLERVNKHDLTVDGKHIEIKFNYDRCQHDLGRELSRCNGNLDSMYFPKGDDRGVGHRICRDITGKNPDIFFWVICSRNIEGIPDNQLKRICFGRDQRKYCKIHPFRPEGADLAVVDLYLDLMQKRHEEHRPFKIYQRQIATKGFFPSIYHFRICEFYSPVHSENLQTNAVAS